MSEAIQHPCTESSVCLPGMVWCGSFDSGAGKGFAGHEEICDVHGDIDWGEGSTCRAPPHPGLPWMRISLPRYDLLREERWPVSQRRRALSLFLNGLSGFNLHRNTERICKAQSLSGSKDQTIDNIQRTMRAYSESGSDS